MHALCALGRREDPPPVLKALGFKMRIFIIFTLLLGLSSASVAATCKCDSPESTLAYYLAAIQQADAEAIIGIYYGVNEFKVYGPRALSTYKIESKKTLAKDMKFENWEGEVPLWAKKDSVQMDVTQVWESGLEEKYFYSFRFIEGKWLLVGHVSENMPE